MSLVFHLIHGARQPTAMLGLLVSRRVLRERIRRVRAGLCRIFCRPGFAMALVVTHVLTLLIKDNPPTPVLGPDGTFLR